MTGTTVKQINNLIITQDNKAKLYRVYAPDGKEIYSNANLADVTARCKRCTQYLKGRARRGKIQGEFGYEFDDGIYANPPVEPVPLTQSMLDELEFECWQLIRQYAASMKIELFDLDGDPVSESGDMACNAAKDVQACILNMFKRAGCTVKFQR